MTWCDVEVPNGVTAAFAPTPCDDKAVGLQLDASLRDLLAEAPQAKYGGRTPETGHLRSLVFIRLITDDAARMVDSHERVSGLPIRWSTPDLAELVTPAGTLAIVRPRTVALFGAG